MSARSPQRIADLSPAAQALAELLPGVYLARNEAVDGRPLLALLEVLARPLAELDDAIADLHDDHFVERASPDALPLLGDLVGARLLSNDPRTTRAVVARTLRWRRRKGNLATLEDVLSLTSGWSTEADEGFRSLLVTQDLAHLVPSRGRTAMLSDPIPLADPLTRRTPLAPVRRRGAAPASSGAGPTGREDDESVEDALRRLGAVDAGRPAVAPRTVDLLGWAQADRVVLRSSQVITVELDGIVLGPGRVVPHRTDAAVAYTGFSLDRVGRALPLAGQVRDEPHIAERSAFHEPSEDVPAGPRRLGMLTPTELAGRDGADDEDITILVDDVVAIGPDLHAGVGDDLQFEPVGPAPLLRLADRDRPSPAEEWRLELLALETGADVELVSTTVRRGGRDPEAVTAEAGLERGGATVGIALTRTTAGIGYRRLATGQWTAADVGEPTGTARSTVAAVDVPGGGRAVVRLEAAPGGGLQLGIWRPDLPGNRWTAQALDLGGLAVGDLPDPDGAKDGPAVAAIGVGADLLLVAPVVAGVGEVQPLGVWSVVDAAGAAPVAVRLDAAPTAQRRPVGRMLPSLCVHDGRLIVAGGEFGTEAGAELRGELAGDVWSLGLSGADAGRWVPHLVRNRQRRVGAQLLSTTGGVVLIGGADELGVLATTVWRADLTRARPAWQPLPGLPVDADRPGTLVASAAGDTVSVVAWADRTAPRHHELLSAARSWTRHAAERDAPNPPAEGEALFEGAELLVTGAPPLPPSEVVFRIDGRGAIAFLPAVDLPAAGDRLVFRVRDDGSTERVRAPGEPDRRSLRLGAGRDASTGERTEAAERLAVPGRLAWRRLTVRQLNLGRWDQPFALDLDDAIGVDPRLGRILVRDELVGERVGATVRVARAAAIGAGFAPTGRAVPDEWTEPQDPLDPERFELPVPPDLDDGRVEGPAPTAAWVSPPRAGSVDGDGIPIVATLSAAMLLASGEISVGISGSPILAPERLTADQGAVVTIWPSDDRTLPHVEQEDGVSLALAERLAADGPGDDPDEGPTWFLAGLSLAGAVELAAMAGRLDLRWCTVGEPGAVAVRVVGAGHQTDLLRASLPRPRIRIRLLGCQLGRLVVPPWAEVLAAGCTFDAADPDAIAVDAAGASVRLRHCTVNGRIRAGRVEASSSVLSGAVTCDRPDLGFLRYCLVAPGGRAPLAYRCRTGAVSFASLDPTNPYHLALAGNNGAGALVAAEGRLTPGAHYDRARAAELAARTDDFLPLALVPFPIDRTADDLRRTQRRSV